MCRKRGMGGHGRKGAEEIVIVACRAASAVALKVVIVVRLNLKASLLKSAAQHNPIAFLIGFRYENMNSCELSSCEHVVKHDVRATLTLLHQSKFEILDWSGVWIKSSDLATTNSHSSVQ